jgi:5-methyltetrahydropteroyltriglutamate--homocysteine methyltransferase
MFATLAGGYTRLPRAGEPDHLDVARRAAARGEFDPRGLRVIENTLIKELVEEQEAAGLELLTDGKVRWLDDLGSFAWTLEGVRVGADGRPRFEREPRWVRPAYADSFRFLRSTTDQPVRQYLLGPYTLARLVDPGDLTRERLTITLADAIAQELRALAESGCQVAQIDEPAACAITTDAERQLYRSAHRRLTHSVDGMHLMLSVLNGSAVQAGARTIFDARYHSYLFDIEDAPDNWLLIAEAPTDRGVVAGIGSTSADRADDLEQIRWAAAMAAALRSRGPDRVGIAPAGTLEGLPREVARERIETLGAIAFELFEHGRAGTLPTDPQALAHEGLVRGWFGEVPGSAVEEARTRDAADSREDEDPTPETS